MAKQKFKLNLSTTAASSLPAATEETTNESKEPSSAVPLLRPAKPQEEDPLRPLELKYISRRKIKFHENNDYQQDDIEMLAESILNYGLIHPMEAYYDGEEDVYILESGERRTRAIDLLLDRYLHADCDEESIEYTLFLKNVKGFANGYPLNVVRPNLTESGDLTELEKINSLLRLDEANLQVREIDPLARAVYLKRQKELLQKRNALLPQYLRININQSLAKNSGLTERTVMKYTSIAEKLIPELQEAFREKSITLNEGSSYAQLTEEEQRCLLELIRSGEKVSKTEIKELKMLLQEREKEKAANLEQLKALQRQKKEAEETLAKKLREHESEMSKLKAEIQEKFATDQKVGDAEREALKNMIKNKEEELSRLRKETQSENARTEKEISDLKRKLAAIEDRPPLEEKEQKLLRMSVAYEATLKNLENSVIAACQAFKKYITLAPEKRDELETAFIKAIQVQKP